MARFYRYARVIIGSREEIDPAESFVIGIDQSRITFNIDKNKESNENRVEINIYNISNETRRIIQRANSFYSLEAGYTDQITSVISSGNIIRAYSENHGPNKVMSLECSEGDETHLQPVYKTYAKETRVVDILADLLGGTNLKFDRDSLNLLYGDITLENNLTLYGSLKDAINKILFVISQRSEIGFEEGLLEWYIENDEFIISSRDTPTETEESVITNERSIILSPQNGLLECEPLFSKELGGEKLGVTLKALLDPNVRVGSIITIRNSIRELDGSYTVQSLGFVGDNHYGDFHMELEATYFQ